MIITIRAAAATSRYTARPAIPVSTRTAAQTATAAGARPSQSNSVTVAATSVSTVTDPVTAGRSCSGAARVGRTLAPCNRSSVIRAGPPCDHSTNTEPLPDRKLSGSRSAPRRHPQRTGLTAGDAPNVPLATVLLGYQQKCCADIGSGGQRLVASPTGRASGWRRASRGSPWTVQATVAIIATAVAPPHLVPPPARCPPGSPRSSSTTSSCFGLRPDSWKGSVLPSARGPVSGAVDTSRFTRGRAQRTTRRFKPDGYTAAPLSTRLCPHPESLQQKNRCATRCGSHGDT